MPPRMPHLPRHLRKTNQQLRRHTTRDSDTPRPAYPARSRPPFFPAFAAAIAKVEARPPPITIKSKLSAMPHTPLFSRIMETSKKIIFPVTFPPFPHISWQKQRSTMKKTTIITATLLALSTLLHAQSGGSLTPPGAPAPTMKSLDEVEARTAISTLPLHHLHPRFLLPHKKPHLRHHRDHHFRQ